MIHKKTQFEEDYRNNIYLMSFFPIEIGQVFIDFKMRKLFKSSFFID
jgi:hypothetical protein